MKKTINKALILLFVAVLLVFTIFIYPISRTAYADEVSVVSETMPDTSTWQRETSYKNGDIIFGKYFRYFYEDNFSINETEYSSPILHIGRTDDVYLTISVNKDYVILIAVLLSSGEQRSYQLSANYNSTDVYVDFYVPIDLGLQFDFSAGYGFYEHVKDSNNDYVLSSRIYQITSDDTVGGKPGSSDKDNLINIFSNISFKDILSVFFVVFLLVGVFSIIPKSTSKKTNYKYKKKQYKY